MTVHCRFFRSSLQSWEKLFDRAAEFATELGPDRLISISHSSDNNEGLVTVWYWDEEDADQESDDQAEQ